LQFHFPETQSRANSLMNNVEGKDIVLGITGSIAAYKSAELVRLLKKAGAEVRVVMTANATWFLNPLTFRTLSGNEVIEDMFSQPGASLSHVLMGQQSDLIVVAPATANILGKIAHGIADDFLSTLIMAASCKVLLCPAMDREMFSNSIVQENILSLDKSGFIIMEPEEGMLASGVVGLGRFPDPSTIVEEIQHILDNKDLAGVKVLVTAGPTIEYIDPVRIVTNRSSGKMGYALARAARRRGAEVTLVSGPTYLEPPRGVTTIHVKTTEEMRDAVLGNCGSNDVIIKAAAVSDYKPLHKAQEKEKKKEGTISVEMVPTPDILTELGKAKGNTILVGFAAETTNHVANAVEKMRKKNLDLIILNDVSKEGRGFAADVNEVRIIDRKGIDEEIPLMSKEDIADRILDRIKTLRTK
jgi:phosphopantothenoylcysteine decarboxylase/phosphopantothenate--cysteine ligase